jgi:Fe2+ transport system protein FeoA
MVWLRIHPILGKGGVMHNANGGEDLNSGLYELVDESGEAQPVYLHAPNKRKGLDRLGGWVIGWQEATMNLAQEKSLNLTDHRVILVLQAKLDFDNWIRLSHSEIGDLLDVKRPNISTSMKKLLEMGIILPGPSVKAVRTYRLNPALAWKGDIKTGYKERRKNLKLIQGGKKEEDPNQLPLL